jgi:hypothetical protein
MPLAILNSVSVARASSSESQSACCRVPLRPMSPGYLEVFLDPVRLSSAALFFRSLSYNAFSVIMAYDITSSLLVSTTRFTLF